ncbi:MAG: hypothetical protein IPO22_02800 [Anaerolineales bacterium]|nr:hypothetical protein [Anaerolineales bacterium]
MNGTSSLKTASKAFPTEWSLTWIQALLLIGGGCDGGGSASRIGYLAGLPGHHGIEWMAIMILWPRFIQISAARGTLASIGASFASVSPPCMAIIRFTWIYHLLPGPVMDLAFRYLPRYANKLWFMVLLGGFAIGRKPIGQLTINLLTGWPIGSFRFGVVYPFVSHLLFGMIGGLLGDGRVWH